MWIWMEELMINVHRNRFHYGNKGVEPLRQWSYVDKKKLKITQDAEMV